MIEKSQSFKTSSGNIFQTIEAAQADEIVHLLGGSGEDGEGHLKLSECAALIVKHRDALVDILSTTPSSRPKARRINGGTKKKKAPPLGEQMLTKP